MKIRLLLQIKDGRTIPVNYQYPLSAVIYKILDRADQEYAAFLHDTGYKKADSLKSFKFFTFSDIRVPFKLAGDRMHLLASDAELLISFHLPQAAAHFIKGLFLNQQIDIADKKSKVVFTVSNVEMLPVVLTDDTVQGLLLQPLSPVVCGKKNEKSNYDFLSPEDPDFIRMLLYNWKEKYAVLYGPERVDMDFAEADMEVVFYGNPPRSRLITIKADTPAETKIRGFVNFRLKVLGRREAVELLIDVGAGLYNSLGMGMLEAVRKEKGV